MPLKAVILNDTRGHPHFGCFRVMRAIEHNLGRRGVEVAATSLVRTEWWNDRSFLEATAASDLIVINGEGTCHHGSRHAEGLLRIVEHPVRGHRPVVLINALYQENPAEWARYLEQMDAIWTRDSWSAAEVRERIGREIPWALDLSMSEGEHPVAETAKRDLLTIGESVVGNVSRSLVKASQTHPQARFLPIVTTMKSRKPEYPAVFRVLRDIYVQGHLLTFKIRNRDSIFSASEQEYAGYLLRSFLHVSGRFHAVCFALTTRTPFLTLPSNSWKIEALFADVGLDLRRIVNPAEIGDLISRPETLKFDAEEEVNLTRALKLAVDNSACMFDEIVSLAHGKRRP
ncbi:polysaccharide pyruvyl transferase family protein [Mesorhizobium sp. CC13]|uniref:polysaccharide pyruvyl transferase family protein n=1 Tax=Mesorhizobium sp. CC13 TaxID=3029194 RepID=UPI003267A350